MNPLTDNYAPGRPERAGFRARFAREERAELADAAMQRRRDANYIRHHTMIGGARVFADFTYYRGRVNA